MKRIAILYSEYTPVIDAIKYQLPDCNIDCFQSGENVINYDLVVILKENIAYDGNAICCHHSLLPAFEGNEPEKNAIIAGVKVTGITIYYTHTKHILAQYPVFIRHEMHYEELKQELNYVEQILFPNVIDKIIKNEPFETLTVMNPKKTSCCGECTSCKH